MVTKNESLLIEPFDIISCTTILGFFYGLAFSLYCLCASSLYLTLQNPDKQHRAMFSLGFISFLFFCATGLCGLNTLVIQLAYINHADFPGGPLEYEATYGSVVEPYQITGSILAFIIEVLTMAIQIWRLWIIWSAAQYAVVVTILPVLLLLVFIALDIPIDIVLNFVPLGIPHSGIIAMGTATYIILSSFTILVTVLIVVRLLLARRRHTKIMGTSDSPYLSIVTVLVESYALESAWSLAVAVSEALNNPSFILFTDNDSMIKIIAYFLIVYRVQQGQGWTKQTERKITSLQFHRGEQSATDEASGLGYEAPATVPIPEIGSSTLNSYDSST